MNTERYIWPVIIAAGLHGALMLSFTDRVMVGHPPIIKDKPWEKTPTDPAPVDLTESETGCISETAGGPTPLPRIPDILKPLSRKTVFTVPVTERLVPINPIGDLKNPVDGPMSGPGDNSFRRSVVSFTNLDRLPRAMVQPSPNYPDTLRQNGITGSVMVEFVVDTAGRVVRAEAVRWTHREFADPAVRAVLRWRFEPGTLNGRKVSFRMAVPIEFNAERLPE